MKFGDKLRQVRKEAGLSMQQLAVRAGMTKATVSKYEHNTRLPRADALYRICAALGVTADQFKDCEFNHKEPTDG